jgi:hypothetical protein
MAPRAPSAISSSSHRLFLVGGDIPDGLFDQRRHTLLRNLRKALQRIGIVLITRM